MSSNSYCSKRDELNTYKCCWNCDRGLKCDYMVKTNAATRRKREFTPDEQKDENYWLKRNRNNEAAKRSRERRRVEQRLMEGRTAQLLRENQKLKAALSTLHYHDVGSAVVQHPPVRDLSRDSYLRSLVDFPVLTPLSGTLQSLPYALSSRCPSSYDSMTLHEMDGFSTASCMTVQDYMQHSHLGLTGSTDGTIHSYVHPTMNLFHNPAPFLPIEKHSISRNSLTDYSGLLGGQDPQGSHSRDAIGLHRDCICNGSKNSQSTPVPDYLPLPATEPECSTIVLGEPCIKESPVTKAREICQKIKPNKGEECVSGLTLLPHKLRYKVSKGHYSGHHMLPSS